MGRLVCTCREEPKGDLSHDGDGGRDGDVDDTDDDDNDENGDDKTL